MQLFTQKDQLLAGCIFVLWSFGLIFAPYAEASFTFATPAITFVYLILHVLIFAYTCYLSVALLGKPRGKKRSFWSVACPALLYAYVLVALVYSAYLLVKLMY